MQVAAALQLRPHRWSQNDPAGGATPSADAELVARQTGVSHDQAAMALEANDGDIVNAIIELTT